jgi:SAM-dependent methyltransferase
LIPDEVWERRESGNLIGGTSVGCKTQQGENVQTERINQQVYASSHVVSSYAKFHDLFPPEQLIFREYADDFRGKVLDIAVGAGRTTKALLEIAQRYVGLDLAAGMIEAARKKFPTADLRTMDMRAVPEVFAAERFNTILIAYNSIDYISWEDRNSLLERLRGLLEPNGLLVFSSHNLDYAKAHPPRFRFPVTTVDDLRAGPKEWFRAPIREAHWVSSALPNYLRNRRLQSHHVGYSYLNDTGEFFGLITCYVSERKQREMLECMGYQVLRVLSAEGTSELGNWNYFVCRLSPRSSTSGKHRDPLSSTMLSLRDA